jgi:hypothetical protein
VDDPASGALISIGEFARRTRLTAKALRIYDQVGLLRAASIDETMIIDDLAVAGDLAVARLQRLVSDIDRRHANASCSSATSKPPCKETTECSQSRPDRSPRDG